jgi:hypothetical protein
MSRRTYRVPVERVTTFKRYVYVEADSPEEAEDAALKKVNTLVWQHQETESYVKRAVPDPNAPRVDIVV